MIKRPLMHVSYIPGLGVDILSEVGKDIKCKSLLRGLS